jgi:probable rRNA maturation factor
MNSVAVDYRDIPLPLWLDRASTFAVSVMDALELDAWELSLFFCGEEFMAGLNLSYRGKEGPTDVLSFQLGEWVDGTNGRRFIAGDVVICTAVMARNAASFGVSEDEELRRLIIHGILHLAGLDHQTNEGNEPMLVRQENLLSTLSEESIF